jgi:ABC-type nitrate/sulfonate/bicarbonate transport system substrate-binding protein
MSDWATAHQDLVKAFARVMVDAARYTNAHHAQTAPLVAEATKIPQATIEQMTRVDSALSINPAMIQPLIDAAAKYGLLSRSFPATEVILKA